MTPNTPQDSQTLAADEVLLPCPFCGGAATVVEVKTCGKTSWADGLGSPGEFELSSPAVQCSNCSARVQIFREGPPTYYAPPTVESIWNTRSALNQGQG